jgi:hypothetical protein
MWRRSTTPASSQTWENTWPTSTHSTVKPSITLTQVGYRKDSRMHNSKAIMAFLMLLSKLQQSQRQSQNPATRIIPALRGVCGHSDKHATRKILEAQCAFKILMIHEVLQFALHIAFRCVLHRCGSLDIRC